MPQNKPIPVSNLKLDLRNYRTVPQPDELHAVRAMIRVSPDRFWALMASMVDGGYLPTENVIILQDDEGMIVREGNRRVAALKLILGNIPCHGITIPDDTAKIIAGLSEEWKKENNQVPCAIYPASESAQVDRIVRLAHGKGEKAGRDPWGSVARARHNRDVNGTSEPALDLLEAFLNTADNVTPQQKERWSGDYKLSVLDEASKKIAARIGASNASDLVRVYPNTAHKEAIDDVLYAIGMEELGFPKIRSKTKDFISDYNFPLAPAPDDPPPAPDPDSPSGRKVAAVAISNPIAVRRALKQLKIMGDNRSKVVTLRDEMARLNLAKTPIAFCFLLRSMFEISSKAYCEDHAGTPGAPTNKKANGEEKKLVEVLREITKHLTKSGRDKVAEKLLHGSMTELAKPEGILSVTSLNQLVHNPNFSLAPADISITFGNIFPLLKEMNQ